MANWNIKNLLVPKNCTLTSYYSAGEPAKTWDAGDYATITNKVGFGSSSDPQIFNVILKEWDDETLICTHTISPSGYSSTATNITFSISFKAEDTSLSFEEYSSRIRQGFAGYNITECTFQNCTNIKYITNLPDTVETFGNPFNGYSFDGCTNIEYVDLSNLSTPLLQLGPLFLNNTKLVEADLPRSFSSLYQTFKGCTSLKRVSCLSDRCTSFVSSFEGCTSLAGDIVMDFSAYHQASDITVTNCFAGTTQEIKLIGENSLESHLCLYKFTQGCPNVSIDFMWESRKWFKFYPTLHNRAEALVDGTYVPYTPDVSLNYIQTFHVINPETDEEELFYGFRFTGEELVDFYGNKYYSPRISYITAFNPSQRPGEPAETEEIVVYSNNRWEADYYRVFSLNNSMPVEGLMAELSRLVEDNTDLDILPWSLDTSSGELLIGEVDEEADITGTIDATCRYFPVTMDSATTPCAPWLEYAEDIKTVEINGNPILMNYWFDGCSNLESINTIPYRAKSLDCTFRNCSSLTGNLSINGIIYNHYQTFYGCSSLKGIMTLNTRFYLNASNMFENTYYNILLVGSDTVGIRKFSSLFENLCVIDIEYNDFAFEVNNSIITKVRVLSTTGTSYRTIPSSYNSMAITNLARTFFGCKNLNVSSITLPSSVVNLDKTFGECTFNRDIKLTIPLNVTSYNETFANTAGNVLLIPGNDTNTNLSVIAEMAAPYENVIYTSYPTLTVNSAGRIGINATTGLSQILIVAKVEFTQDNSNYIVPPEIYHSIDETGKHYELQNFRWFLDAQMSEPFEEGAHYNEQSSIVLYGINDNEGYDLNALIEGRIDVNDKFLEANQYYSISRYVPLIDFDAINGKEISIGCMSTMEYGDEPIGVLRCAMDMTFELLNNLTIVDTGTELIITAPDSSYTSDDYLLAQEIISMFDYETAKTLLNV